MTDHRNIIESLVDQFASAANRGAQHHTAAILPQIVSKLLDMIEHYAGVAPAEPEAQKAPETASGVKSANSSESDVPAQVAEKTAPVEPPAATPVEADDEDAIATTQVEVTPEDLADAPTDEDADKTDVADKKAKAKKAKAE